MNAFSGSPRPSAGQVYRKIGNRAIVTEPPTFHPRTSPTETAPDLPLEITFSRPSYIPAPSNSSSSVVPVYVKFGTINNVLATNIFTPHQASLSTSATPKQTYIYAEVTLGQQDDLTVQSWTIRIDDTAPEASSAWEASLTRPTTVNVILGYTLHTVDGGWTIVASSGDLMIEEYLTSVNSDTGSFTRRVAARRV